MVLEPITFCCSIKIQMNFASNSKIKINTMNTFFQEWIFTRFLKNFMGFQIGKHEKMISVKISAGQFESICVDEVSLVLYAMEINKSVLTCFDLRTPTKVLIFNGKLSVKLELKMRIFKWTLGGTK